MKIEIENFNNISKVEYVIKNKKINFLVGISGCGKSSIANALSKQDYTEYVKVGKSLNDVKVKIDGNEVDYENIAKFDLDYMNDILIKKDKEEDIYNIIVGDTGSIESIRNKYIETISDLLLQSNKIIELKSNVEVLIKQLSIKYTKEEQYYSSCAIAKLQNSIKEDTKRYMKAKELSHKSIKWYIDGKETEKYHQGKCPFCDKKLSSNRIQYIEDITKFETSAFEKINNQSGIFVKLGIDLPNWSNKREYNEFNKKIKSYVDILHELDTLLRYINISKQLDINFDNLNIEKPSTNLKEVNQEIYNVYLDFYKNINTIKKDIAKLKSASDRLIRSNLNKINEKLMILGLKYEFVKMFISENDKKAKYIIKHIESKEEKDMTMNLSYGEQNLIGLILFLISKKDKPFLIIDDPASSFDEYRRKVVLDMIYSLTNTESTVLILSHDQVFAKIACYHYNDAIKVTKKSNIQKLYFSRTGKIDYIETYEGCKIIPIEIDSFASINDFIRHRIESFTGNMSYKIAINLRIYFELNKSIKCHKLIYGYLSSILHKFDKSYIIEQLSKNNKTEEDILGYIKDNVGKLFNPLPDNFQNDINYDELSTFERLIYIRENLNGRSESKKVIKDELSNIIHLDSAYAICLNPYIYNSFSNYVYDIIKDEDEKRKA